MCYCSSLSLLWGGAYFPFDLNLGITFTPIFFLQPLFPLYLKASDNHNYSDLLSHMHFIGEYSIFKKGLLKQKAENWKHSLITHN